MTKITAEQARSADAIKSERSPSVSLLDSHETLPNKKHAALDITNTAHQYRTKADASSSIKLELGTPNQDAIFIRGASEESFESYYYECCMCQAKRADFASFILHRKQVHNMIYRRKCIKHPELEPNVYDSDFHCQTCELDFTTELRYRAHLRIQHSIIIKVPPYKFRKNGIKLDPNEPNHYCHSCEKSFVKSEYYRRHLKDFHLMKLEPPKRVPQSNIKPDWNNPELHCVACTYTFSSKSAYHNHCKSKHNVQPPPKPQLAGELPDRTDANFYCKVCDVTCKNKSQFMDHCRRQHPLTNERKKAPKSVAGPLYCEPCDILYKRYANYRLHLRRVHESSLSDANRRRQIIPEKNQPDNHCAACDKTLASKRSYREHLMAIHRHLANVSDQGSIRPDMNDERNYCCVCQRTYSTRTDYHSHIQRVHKMVVPPAILEAISSSNDVHQYPDPLDPNFYCRVCDSAMISLNRFRAHCRSKHRMTLPPSEKQFKNPDAEIDLHSPDNYCAKCDKHLTNRSSFGYHLKTIHALTQKFVNPNAVIDINHPKLFCAKCEKHLSNKRTFQYHLLNVHKVDPALIVNRT